MALVSAINKTAMGRLVPIFSASEYSGEHGSDSADLVLALTRAAAQSGDSVLMLDQINGALMQKAGIIAGANLGDVLAGRASIRDAKYISVKENYTAIMLGNLALENALGSLAALSLNYDWVFMACAHGCTPAHIRLASAADTCLLSYETKSDNFMRAYWFIDAVRSRVPDFDPLMIACGSEDEGLETSQLLQETINDFLGAAPALGGVLDSKESASLIAPVLLEALRHESNKLAKLA